MEKYLTQTANVFVFESTGRWTAAIARKLPDAKVTRSLSLPQLQIDCRENAFSAAVIEIDLGNLARTASDAKDTVSAAKIYESVFACPPNKSTRFFAAVEGRAGGLQNKQLHSELLNSLIELGFTATVSGIGEIDRLQFMLKRHFQTTHAPKQSIENLVTECLPW